MRSGPTLGDVAAAAEVSLATASRALSNPGRVSLETVARVRRSPMIWGIGHSCMEIESIAKASRWWSSSQVGGHSRAT